jgi:hypothetical protein
MRATHLASARAHQVIDAERWDDPSLAWDLGAMAWPSATALDRFTQGFAAIRRGDRARANAEMAALDRELGDTDNPLARLIGQELRAALLRADGRKPDAEALLRTIAADFAALPVDFGPPDFVKPPMELLGEWLLEDNRPADAKAAFTSALTAMPGRILSLRGLQLAAGRSGS